jgi:hypothetical protein
MDLLGITTAVKSVTDLVSKWIPDKTQEEQNKFILELTEVQGQIAAVQGQIDTNKTEAANPSIFVSGWRPFIGWCCGVACAWNWMGISLAKFICALIHYPVDLAPASLSEMMPVLFTLLGLGGIRTYEKLQGVARS